MVLTIGVDLCETGLADDQLIGIDQDTELSVEVEGVGVVVSHFKDKAI